MRTTRRNEKITSKRSLHRQRDVDSIIVNEHTLCRRILWWMCCVIFCSIAGFWIELTIASYNSEPVASVVSMKRNVTFTWPAITFCPKERYYNKVILKELSKQYNLTLEHKQLLNYKDSDPFNLTASNFDFQQYNFSNILTKARFINRRSVIKNCDSLTEFYESCLNETSAVGKWSVHDTRFSPCFQFTPNPANDITDVIRITVDTSTLASYHVAIHTPEDIYYRLDGPTIMEFNLREGDSLDLSLHVQEYESINRESSNCVEDLEYSQSVCNEMKIKKQVMEDAGCYFTAVTGLPSENYYPECNNLNAYMKLQHVYRSFNKTFLSGGSGVASDKRLLNIQGRCLPPCKTKIFLTKGVNRATYDSYFKEQEELVIRLSIDSMYYLHVKEEPAMTIEELVASIGGILGIFLGVSCFTGVSGIEWASGYINNSIRKMIRKYNLQ